MGLGADIPGFFIVQLLPLQLGLIFSPIISSLHFHHHKHLDKEVRGNCNSGISFVFGSYKFFILASTLPCPLLPQ